jgi:predicted ATP-grasp superfamily ATP-dependent carboligase
VTQFSYAALCDSGRPLASIVVRRARQWPIEFGRSSTFVESIESPEIEDIAERLLEAIGFSGLIEVEFKRDPQSGSFKLLDVNPRLWGWHSIGRAAGVDFPHLAWTNLQSPLASRLRGTPGVRWVHGVTDVPMVLLEMARGHRSPFSYLRSIRPPLEMAVLASDDPLPALVEVPMNLYLLWRRREEFGSLLPRSA